MRLGSAALCAALLAAAAGEPRSQQDVSSDFVLPAGYRAQLWAASPQLYNPTAMDVDARGRLWVCEAVNYRRFHKGRNPGRTHARGDRVVILEDVDGDGRCDSSKVFVQDRDLLAPLGIVVLGSRVLVSCSPHAIVYTDLDGDDAPDHKEIFLTGFGGKDHDHGLHSFVGGPDGLLYFNVGNAGPHVVRDRAGFTLRSGSLYRGGAGKAPPNRPGMRSDDGRVWTGGLVLRVGTEGRGLQVLAHNFRNPYEVAVDSFGDLWQSDNDDDGNRATRTLWVMEGGNYGFFGGGGTRSWQADRRPGQDTWTAHWHQDDPGVSPAGYRNGAGGPTGVCVYEDGVLPQSWRGTVLDADAGQGVVYAHRPRRQGAGFRLEKRELIRSRGGPQESRRWFRPSDVAVGIDGSVFVSDWYDPGVGGHAMGDRQARGRILRVVPDGVPVVRPDIDLTTFDGARAALDNPAPSIRWCASARLLQDPRALLPLLLGRLGADDPIVAARSVFLAARLGAKGEPLCRRMLEHDSPRVRIAALRALRLCADPATQVEMAARLVADRDPAMRREVAILLWRLGDRVPRALLDRLVKSYRGEDRVLLEAIGLAAEDRASELLRPAGDPLRWTAAWADLAWRLHPPSFLDAFLCRAHSPALPLAERRRAVDAIAFMPHRAAASAMLDLAQVGPDALRGLARAWVRQRHDNLWLAWRPADRLPSFDPAGAVPVWRSGWLRKGSPPVAVDVDVRGADVLVLVVDGGESISHDWADWIEPRLSGERGETPLTDLAWERATIGWGKVRIGRNAGGERLAIDGKRFADGIGTHANSRIAWRLDRRKWHRLRARAGIDDGGSRQPGARPELEFRVYLHRPPDTSWIGGALASMRDATLDADSRRRAIERLAQDRTGALRLLRLADRGELAGALRAGVGEALRRNPDLSIRALASARFPRTTRSGATLPPLEELARQPGDAIRGRRIFFGDRALCSSCHAYGTRGKDIGPDLTSIRSKYGRAALLDAMLNPSAGIALGYDTWLVETEDGELYTGFVLVDGETLVLKDTSGQRRRIPAEKIASRHKQSVSTMPDNVALGLSARELADVASFLLDDPAVELVAGRPIDLLDHGLEAWRSFPAARDVWQLEDGVLRCKGRPAGYLRTAREFTNFLLELEWRFPPGSTPGNSGVLLRTVGQDRIWPTSVEAQLLHRNAGDIWNIGDFPMLVDPLRTTGRRTRKLAQSSEKAPGRWNRYQIRLARGNLELRVNGVLQNFADDVDERPGAICLQSEGAPIEFRRIRLTPLVRPR